MPFVLQTILVGYHSFNINVPASGIHLFNQHSKNIEAINTFGYLQKIKQPISHQLRMLCTVNTKYPKVMAKHGLVEISWSLSLFLAPVN